MNFYAKTLAQTYAELKSDQDGLSDSDASNRLEKYGFNRVSVKGEPLWRKIIEPFMDVFMGVLAVAVIISAWHGDYLEVVIITVIMLISAVIYYVQRFSTERVLRALRSQTHEKIEVLRDGRNILLDTEKIVPGDIILLSEGEKIPADARVLSVSSLRVDESQLTGESVPVNKQTSPLKGTKEVYEQSNMVFQGSFVVGGTATAMVVATANQTQFGKLAALSSDVSAISPVQVKINHLITRIVIAIIFISVVAFGLAMRQGMDAVEALRFVIALAVSAVPEGLPIAISVVLVLGMRRMAAKKALVRTMRAIETLGTVTTIATDKTGTLTKNRLTVHETWQPPSVSMNIVKAMQGSLNYGDKHVHDPLDVAFYEYLAANGAKTSPKPITKFAFDQALSMSGGLFHYGKDFQLFIKGAPEAILSRAKLTASERKSAEKKLNQLTSKGYRVIALGSLTAAHQ